MSIFGPARPACALLRERAPRATARRSAPVALWSAEQAHAVRVPIRVARCGSPIRRGYETVW